jgi:hypothetical protein
MPYDTNPNKYNANNEATKARYQVEADAKLDSIFTDDNGLSFGFMIGKGKETTWKFDEQPYCDSTIDEEGVGCDDFCDQCDEKAESWLKDINTTLKDTSSGAGETLTSVLSGFLEGFTGFSLPSWVKPIFILFGLYLMYTMFSPKK